MSHENKTKPWADVFEFDEVADAMCCDCGFKYGSIDCKGCDFYRVEK